MTHILCLTFRDRLGLESAEVVGLGRRRVVGRVPRGINIFLASVLEEALAVSPGNAGVIPPGAGQRPLLLGVEVLRSPESLRW